ncbi:MAG: M23 family metallopeptidase [Kofleriaceae bacterium]
MPTWHDRGLSRLLVIAFVLAGCAKKPPACTDDLPRLRWPLGGQVSKDWFVTAWVDDDPGPGTRDFTGAVGASAITHDTHDGIDIALARGFAEQDEGIGIFSACEGIVSQTGDGQPDRNSDSNKEAIGNFVIVTAPNGYKVVYWHLRRGSVSVHVGDRVVAGTRLGEVGSSGESSGPHLHFSVYDCAGKAIDPMVTRAFENPPPYHPPHALVSARYALEGRTVHGDLMFTAMPAHETVTLTFITPDGTSIPGATTTGPEFLPGFFWKPDFTADRPGPWTLVLQIGDEVVDRRTLDVP